MPAVSSTSEEAAEELRPGRASSLRYDFLWTLMGNGIFAASQWIVIVMLAKLSRPELVGKYSFALAVGTPLITFASFQLRSVQVTDVRGEHQFSDYLGFRLLSMGGAMVALTVLCLAMRYQPSMTALIEALALGLAVESVSDVYYGRMQAHSRMDSIAKSMILRGVLSSLATVAVVVATGSLLLGVLAMVAARMGVLLLFDRSLKKTIAPMPVRPCDLGARPRVQWPRQKTLLFTTLPIGLVSVLVSLNTSIPRYFIEWAAGPRELGIFAALSFFQSSGNMVVGAMGQAAFGRLATSYAEEDRRKFFALLFRLVAVGVGLGAAGVLVAAFAGHWILQVMFRHEYADRADLLVRLMIAAGLGYCCQFVGSAVTAARIFKPQMALFLVVASSLTLFCCLFVPGHGAAGAVSAIMAATVVQIVGFALLLLFSTRRRGGQNTPGFERADQMAVAESGR